MNRTLRRRLARAKKQCVVKPEPDPDSMDGQEWLIWAMDRYGLEELVRQSYVAAGEPDPLARDGAKRKTVATEAAAPEAREARVEATPAAIEVEKAPPEPKPEPQWWEEKCRWRERGPGDFCDDEGLYETLHEYDPLADDLEG
ncbi:MAG: hypothetical protein NTV97_08825 [Alphaproteobacteria bacterium]|nr:hypothetical protein [Alphaproteobacteria bacterium]